MPDVDPLMRVLAADVGGTHIRLAWVDADGGMGEEKRVRAEFSRHDVCADDVIASLADVFAAYMDEQGEVQAITLGFPGFFLGHTGVLAASPNLPNLTNLPLAEKLALALSLPVMAQNDALCAALGEQRFGVAQGVQNLLHITLGTGVGGGLILQGQAYTGEAGMAMEFGHMRVNHGADARLCGCGNNGCVEAYVSVTAIRQQYKDMTGEDADAAVIYQRAGAGDTQARYLFEQAGDKLGQALAEAVKLLDVHTITVSGGLLGAWDMMEAALMNSLNQHVIYPLQGKIRVLPSSLGDRAGILGAAALALLAV